MDPHDAPTVLPRRDFVKLSGLGAAALAAGASGCAPGEQAVRPDERADPQWWTRLEFELEETPVAELQEGMASGRWSAREITQLYLDRIALLDRSGPRLRSVIETNPDALAIAEALDRERRDGSVRGPLHGIPIILKDNIDTADGMVTAAGSLALEGHHAARDSWVAERLRAAGAILLAKANLSEWANFRSTNSSSGWGGRGGQCGNPYAVDRNPCGSSSGSGAAASANFSAGAVGTETNGSVVCPASINAAPARCHRLPHHPGRVGHGPGEQRRVQRGQLGARRRRRVSERHGAQRLRPGAPRGDPLLRAGVE